MNLEFKLLDIIKNSLSDSTLIGDDCAYLKKYKLALSQDSLIEDVHFSLSYMSPYEIAKKALLVNISDILASGAVPEYASISLGGKLTCEFVEDFYCGIDEIAKKFKIKITGGDLVKSEKINISVAILGNCKKRRPSSRANAKEGYIVATAGEFGSSAQGLEDLRKGIKNNKFVKLHKEPKLYKNIALQISEKTKYPYAMMDSSDGLIDALCQISDKSSLRIDFQYDKIKKTTKNKDYVLYGGEDYSLVVCLSQKDFKKIKGLNQIGICSFGKGVYMDNKKMEHRGFEHFEN